MRKAVILDLDGVMITTPNWKADKMHKDGYSDFNQVGVHNLKTLLSTIEDVELWLSSSRRRNKTLEEFRLIFLNREIDTKLTGFLPGGYGGASRYDEIRAFLSHEFIDKYLILDDDSSLENLPPEQKRKWIKTKPLIGFDDLKLEEARRIISEWNNE